MAQPSKLLDSQKWTYQTKYVVPFLQCNFTHTQMNVLVGWDTTFRQLGNATVALTSTKLFIQTTCIRLALLVSVKVPHTHIETNSRCFEIQLRKSIIQHSHLTYHYFHPILRYLDLLGTCVVPQKWYLHFLKCLWLHSHPHPAHVLPNTAAMVLGHSEGWAQATPYAASLRCLVKEWQWRLGNLHKKGKVVSQTFPQFHWLEMRYQKKESAIVKEAF